jgi:hypothetical protein
VSNLSEFDGGGMIPLITTTYTSGAGTFTPSVSGGLCRITIEPAGGGGARSAVASGGRSGAGGGGGGAFEVWLRLTAAQSWSVGAAGLGATANGTSGTDASACTFGTFIAPGGKGGLTSGVGGDGGFVGPTISNPVSQSLPGGAGGSGRNSGLLSGLSGQAPGFPIGQALDAAGLTNSNNGGAAGANGPGGGGGGHSKNGKGGDGGAGGGATGAAGAAGTGFGGGGGGGGWGTGTTGNGGNGSGGRITVEEFGL